MARKTHYMEYVKHVTGGQAEKPALSIKEKLSAMKEKAKTANQKPVKEGN